MKSVKETSNINTNNLDHELLKSYVSSLKNDDFKKLVNRLKLNEETLMKYTSKLEKTVNELNNCKNCKCLEMCKNKVSGCVYYPKVIDNRLNFDYKACKYFLEYLEKEKNKPIVFEEPLEIKNASFSNIDLTDKKRAHVIKWIKSFYNNYENNKNIKGTYLHGSFGSGKSYLIAALINELTKKGVKAVIIYYPEMLRILKESFNDDFNIKMDLIKRSDILLIDDIGAESLTSWSRDEILGTILQYRMDSKLPTFFTSNLNQEELEIHLAKEKGSIDLVKSKRIIERIKQLTDDLELISENRRK